MLVQVVALPSELNPNRDLAGKSVIVLDVLRATTSMIVGLSAGAKEIVVFDDLDAASAAARSHPQPRFLCGERNCLPPQGFDLGNSPCTFADPAIRDATLLMCTTNGTRAIHAAMHSAATSAPFQVLVAALVNAGATARHLAASGRDATLLCAGTDGLAAMEDLIGAGAIVAALSAVGAQPASDMTQIAHRLFESARLDLPAALRESRGGHNILSANLAADIDYAASLDRHELVAKVREIGSCVKVSRLN